MLVAHTLCDVRLIPQVAAAEARLARPRAPSQQRMLARTGDSWCTVRADVSEHTVGAYVV